MPSVSEEKRKISREKGNFPGEKSSQVMMHPKTFETRYIRKDSLEDDLRKLLLDMDELDYRSLNDYDKGGYDGFNQAITLILKKLQTLT